MRKVIVAAAIVASLSSVGAATAEAQAVESQWAQQFVGSWNVQLDTPDGQVPLVVTVQEDGGEFVVVLGSGQGDGNAIREVRREGESLVATYEMDYQGMPIDARLQLQRDGDALSTRWSFAGGAYETSANGTRR